MAIGHGGPEEVGEAGGEFELVDGPFGFAGLVFFDAEEEGWVDEEGLEWGADGLLVGHAGGGVFGEEFEHGREVVRDDAAAEGEGGVVGEGGAGGVFGLDFVGGFGDEDAVELGGVGVEGFDDFAGGGEVFLHEDGRDEEGVADVVEAFAACAVGGEFAAGGEVDAEEVADGVVVFVAVEATDGGAAGVWGEGAGFEFGEDGFDFADHGGALVGGGEGIDVVLGRHVAGFDLFGDVFEEAVVAEGCVG